MSGFLGLPGFNKAPTQAAAPAAGWTRPESWPALPTTAADQVDMLVAVFDTTSNYIAFKFTTSSGNYHVDWGDGTSEDVASTVNAEHQYTYSDVDLDTGTVSEFGYKTAAVQITPTTGGQNLTAMDLAQTHSRTGLQTRHSTGIIDLVVNLPSATSITIGDATDSSRVAQLEEFRLVNKGSVTSFSQLLAGCANLKKVTFDSGTFTSVTSIYRMCYGCRALESIDFPSGSLASVTNTAQSFLGTTSLRSVTFPAGSLAANSLNASSMFNGSGVTEVIFPSGAFSGTSVDIDSIFYASSIKTVTFPTGALGNMVDYATSLFATSTTVESVVFPDGAFTNVANMANMFSGCTALRIIDFGGSTTTALSSVTTTSNMFANCYSLEKIGNCAIPVSFSLANSSIGATELDAIYTALPTISSQTITVTGNHGTDADTPTIATAKGWTVS